MKIPRSRFLALALATATTLALGCGGDDPTDPGGNDDDDDDDDNGDTGGDVTNIGLTSGLSFDPASVTISAGTTVRWTNQANIGHTVTPDGHSEWTEWSTGTQGETFEHTFDTPGTFDYFCSPHLADGMTGTIIVQ